MNIKKIALFLMSPFISLAAIVAKRVDSPVLTSAIKDVKSSYMGSVSSTHWMYIGIAIVLVLLLVLLVWVKRKKK